MIKNERQYEYTQELAKRCEHTLANYDAQDEEVKNNDPWWSAMRESIQSHLDAFRAEITDYERLLKCDRTQHISLKVESINKLPDALIKARIAAQINQQELAQILGIEEGRVKQYEDTDYQCASFVEILEVCTVLAVEFEIAVVRVDFEEIEAVKQSAEKWRKGKIKSPLIAGESA